MRRYDTTHQHPVCCYAIHHLISLLHENGVLIESAKGDAVSAEALAVDAAVTVKADYDAPSTRSDPALPARFAIGVLGAGEGKAAGGWATIR